jgi:hypothetical protein
MADIAVRRPWNVTVRLTEPRDFNGETRVFTKDHEVALNESLSTLTPPPKVQVTGDRVTIRIRVDGATKLEAWQVAERAGEAVLTASIADVEIFALITELAPE